MGANSKTCLMLIMLYTPMWWVKSQRYNLTINYGK